MSSILVMPGMPVIAGQLIDKRKQYQSYREKQKKLFDKVVPKLQDLILNKTDTEINYILNEIQLLIPYDYKGHVKVYVNQDYFILDPLTCKLLTKGYGTFYDLPVNRIYETNNILPAKIIIGKGKEHYVTVFPFGLDKRGFVVKTEQMLIDRHERIPKGVPDIICRNIKLGIYYSKEYMDIIYYKIKHYIQVPVWM